MKRRVEEEVKEDYGWGWCEIIHYHSDRNDSDGDDTKLGGSVCSLDIYNMDTHSWLSLDAIYQLIYLSYSERKSSVRQKK